VLVGEVRKLLSVVCKSAMPQVYRGLAMSDQINDPSPTKVPESVVKASYPHGEHWLLRGVDDLEKQELTLWNDETMSLGNRSDIHESKNSLGLQEFHSTF
jgi:hypothetical protein